VRPPRKIQVSKDEIAGFVKENPCVTNWIVRYQAGSHGAWELVLEWAYKDWRKEKMVKDEKVGWVAKTLKTLASLLVIVLYPIALFAPVIIFLV